MDEELPTLPDDVIRLIFKDAKLDIDTRKALRVKPGRLTEDPAYDAVRERLKATHTRRLEMWKRSQAARMQDAFAPLEVINTPDIVLGPRRHMYVTIEVWDLDDEVRMSIEAIEVVDDDPEDPSAHLLPPGGGEAFVRRGSYCIVPTGEACPRLCDDDDEDLY
jgi:hypothetical protein